MKSKINSLYSILLALVLSISLFSSGCTSSTSYGDCVGAFDKANAEMIHPNLHYKLSGWNLFMAVVVGPTLMFVPTIVVLMDETFCPDRFNTTPNIEVTGPQLP